MSNGTNKFTEKETVKDCSTCGYKGGSQKRCDLCKKTATKYEPYPFWKPKKGESE